MKGKFLTATEAHCWVRCTSVTFRVQARASAVTCRVRSAYDRYMRQPVPVLLERDAIRLEPLAHDHAERLAAAVRDGSLWELWFANAPAPDEVATYTDTARGHMLPWAVRDLATNTIVGSTRYHETAASATP